MHSIASASYATMRDENRYQPPTIAAEPFSAEPMEGVYRAGDMLVMHRGATLPARCIKSNAPAAKMSSWKLVQQPPLWLMALPLLTAACFLIALWLSIPLIVQCVLFAAIILTVVVTGWTRPRATIVAGLSEAWLQRRRKRRLIAAVVLGGGGALTLAPLPSFVPWHLFMTVFVAGQALTYIGLGCLLWSEMLIRAKKIDKHFIWVKGVCPEYLEDLPVFPG